MTYGLILRLEGSMVIMADKVFTIEDLLPEKIHLDMPRDT